MGADTAGVTGAVMVKLRGAVTIGVDGAETIPPCGADTIEVEGAETILLCEADWPKFCRGSRRCGPSTATDGADEERCGFANRVCWRESAGCGSGEC